MSNQTLNLTPTRPYMVRAFYEWLEDNALTPYLVVNATQDNLIIPTEYVQDGRITLSIASRSTSNMTIDNDYISFAARFGGVSKDLWIPMQAVLALLAKEDPNIIMPFDPREYDNYQANDIKQSKNTKQPSKPSKAGSSASKSDKPKRENKAGLKVLK